MEINEIGYINSLTIIKSTIFENLIHKKGSEITRISFKINREISSNTIILNQNVKDEDLDNFFNLIKKQDENKCLK